jgi:hypothetical protein
MDTVTPALTGLSQYGATGIILAALLGVFLWAFRRMFDSILKQQVDFKTFMDGSVKALQDIHSEIGVMREEANDHHHDLIVRLK